MYCKRFEYLELVHFQCDCRKCSGGRLDTGFTNVSRVGGLTEPFRFGDQQTMLIAFFVLLGGSKCLRNCGGRAPVERQGEY